MSRRRPSISSRRARRLALAACGLLLGATPAFCADEDADKLVESIQQRVQGIYDKSGPAIARIEATYLNGRLAGSGFFIDPNGTLYTSYSVGGESHDIVVHFGGKQYPATRLISDLRSGVALLKIDAQTPFLTFGKARDLALAAPIVALGFPLEKPLTPAFGIVGGFDIKHGDRYFATTHIRANLPIQRGENGAPLLNLKGEVVGILISTLDGGSGGFVLPIEAAEKVRMDFMRFHEVRPGWLGIAVRAAESQTDGPSVRIDEVMPDAPAQKAGLLAGDILLQIGTRKITVPEDVLDASFFLTADDNVPVRVNRTGVELEIELQPADPPTARRAELPPTGLPRQGLKVGQ
jgi:S1-C subfamily serine protease